MVLFIENGYSGTPGAGHDKQLAAKQNSVFVFTTSRGNLVVLKIENVPKFIKTPRKVAKSFYEFAEHNYVPRSDLQQKIVSAHIRYNRARV